MVILWIDLGFRGLGFRVTLKTQHLRNWQASGLLGILYVVRGFGTDAAVPTIPPTRDVLQLWYPVPEAGDEACDRRIIWHRISVVMPRFLDHTSRARHDTLRYRLQS